MAIPLPSSWASVLGVHSLPVICINSRTIEESCEDTSISTNGVQGQRDPIHRGEQEDRKGKYKCLMIAFSDTAIYPQNSTGGKTNMFLKVLYITQIIHKSFKNRNSLNSSHQKAILLFNFSELKTCPLRDAVLQSLLFTKWNPIIHLSTRLSKTQNLAI